MCIQTWSSTFKLQRTKCLLYRYWHLHYQDISMSWWVVPLNTQMKKCTIVENKYPCVSNHMSCNLHTNGRNKIWEISHTSTLTQKIEGHHVYNSNHLIYMITLYFDLKLPSSSQWMTSTIPNIFMYHLFNII